MVMRMVGYPYLSTTSVKTLSDLFDILRGSDPLLGGDVKSGERHLAVYLQQMRGLSFHGGDVLAYRAYVAPDKRAGPCGGQTVLEQRLRRARHDGRYRLERVVPLDAELPPQLRNRADQGVQHSARHDDRRMVERLVLRPEKDRRPAQLLGQRGQRLPCLLVPLDAERRPRQRLHRLFH